jgi:hypothetical protein
MPARPQESLAEREDALWAELHAQRASISAVQADMEADRGSAREVLHPCLLPQNFLQCLLWHRLFPKPLQSLPSVPFVQQHWALACIRHS